MSDELKHSDEASDGGAAPAPPGRVNPAGSEAVKWGAIVVIVLAILYFLARYVVPLF